MRMDANGKRMARKPTHGLGSCLVTRGVAETLSIFGESYVAPT